MDELIKTIDSYVKKVPSLPTNFKEIIVKFAPWVAIIAVVFSIPALISLFGINSYMDTIGLRHYVYSQLGAEYRIRYYMTQAFLVVNLVLRGLSIPGLFSRSKSGWMFMFYSTLVYAIYSLITSGILGSLIGLAFSLYFLFQVRPYYTGEVIIAETKNKPEDTPTEENKIE